MILRFLIRISILRKKISRHSLTPLTVICSSIGMNIKRLSKLPHCLAMQNIVHRILETCGQKRDDLPDSVVATSPQKQKKTAGMRVKLTDKEELNKLVPPKLQIRQIKNLLLSLCYIPPTK